MLSNQIAAKVMRTVGAGLLCFATGSAVAVLAQTPEEWIKYTSTEGRYSVMLPAQPTIGSQEATSSDGVKFTQYKAGVLSSDVAYMIGYFDYRGEMTFTLSRARDGMVAGVKGTLVSERSISLGGYPGSDLRVLAKDETGTEYDMRSRFYDIDRRVYVIQFIAPKSTPVEIVDPKAARYFDSFQVLKTP
jgi:hypothetical protein